MRELSEGRFTQHSCYLHQESFHTILEGIALPSQERVEAQHRLVF